MSDEIKVHPAIPIRIGRVHRMRAPTSGSIVRQRGPSIINFGCLAAVGLGLGPPVHLSKGPGTYPGADRGREKKVKFIGKTVERPTTNAYSNGAAVVL